MGWKRGIEYTCDMCKTRMFVENDENGCASRPNEWKEVVNTDTFGYVLLCPSCSQIYWDFMFLFENYPDETRKLLDSYLEENV